MKECWINVYDGYVVAHYSRFHAIFYGYSDRILYRIHVRLK